MTRISIQTVTTKDYRTEQVGQYVGRLVMRRLGLKWCYKRLSYQKGVITRADKPWYKNNKNIVKFITKSR